MAVYYNEIDPYAAQWIRNLIDAGHIAPGVVDERSIVDVKPIDLAGFSQCHFFAGIGVWSLALRRAGWPDDKPIWTGSCPCQPFSSAGKGNGFDDERHLWPHFQWLIQQCRPPVVIGEQVASKDTNPWIDLVHADLEAMGYAFGCVPFPSAGVGAPHIRDRAYWVANSKELSQRTLNGESGESIRQQVETGGHRIFGGMANTCDTGLQGAERSWSPGEEGPSSGHGSECGGARRLANAHGSRSKTGLSAPRHRQEGDARIIDHSGDQFSREQGPPDPASTCPVNGLWSTADWLHCRDGKWRPVEPGTFPLANGVANRVGRLRAYGNAINAYQAQVFIESVMDII